MTRVEASRHSTLSDSSRTASALYLAVDSALPPSDPTPESACNIGPSPRAARPPCFEVPLPLPVPLARRPCSWRSAGRPTNLTVTPKDARRKTRRELEGGGC